MTGRRNGTETSHDVVVDPFRAPDATYLLADAPLRTRVVVEGTVWETNTVTWAGGPVLEVVIADSSDTITLVFLGRHEVGGIQPGRRVVVAGTIGTHRGQRVILNPQIWLLPTRPVAAVAATPQPELVFQH